MTPKIISYDVEIKSTSKVWVQAIPEVYTNDSNTVEIQFNLTDCTESELLNSTAQVLLYMQDGSFFQNSGADVVRDGTTFAYTLKDNEGNHQGLTEVQLVLTIVGTPNEDYASQMYQFKIKNGLGNNVPVETFIQTWETLTAEANAFIAQMEADVQEFDVALENGVLATNIVSKLNNLETTYAPRLLSAEEQLAHKANITDLPSSAFVFKGNVLFATLPTTGNAIGDVYYATDTLQNYAWSGTAWLEIGKTDLANRSITRNKMGEFSFADIWGGTLDPQTFLLNADTGVVSVGSDVFSGFWQGVWFSTPNLQSYNYINYVGSLILGYSATKLLVISGSTGELLILDRGANTFTNLGTSGWSSVPVIRNKEIVIDITNNVLNIDSVDNTIHTTINLATVSGLTLSNFTFDILGSAWMNVSTYPKGASLFKLTSGEAVLWSSFYDRDLADLQSQIKVVATNQWEGKTWHAYGTSMTSVAQGAFVPVVTALSGLVTTNFGIPGGTIADNIKTAVLAAAYDVDLITFEAGLNDFSTLPLGVLGDTTATTYYGCVDICLRSLNANTRARIITIGMTSSYKSAIDGTPYTAYRINPFGNTWRDYCKALREVSNMYGIKYIDIHGESGLGIGRQSIENTVDHIHHNNLGGKNVGEYFWSELKNITPYYTAV